MKATSIRVLALAGGANLLLAAAAMGQPVTYTPGPCSGEVNISGATLFRPFFEAPASTNDFIDADMDGITGFDPLRIPAVDQLAVTFPGRGSPLSTYWAVNYRGVGSVNGLGEFIDFQLCGTFSGSVPAEVGLLNRFQWASGGVRQPAGVPSWPDCNGNGDMNDDSGTPVCPGSIDLAIADVPTSWATIGGAGTPSWNVGPASAGYGQCPILSNTGWSNRLQSLSRNCGPGGSTVSLNTNIGSPDANTVFDTTVAWAPIAYIANRGVGLGDRDGDGEKCDLDMSDLRHLFLTGRSASGENLAVATRSGGSGTRNGMMNTSGIDPSWGRGDNMDNEWAVTNDANLGANRRLTNAEGSSNIERAVQVSRLGIGYTGLVGNDRAAFDAAAGRYELVNVKFDDRGGTDYVRPSLTAVLDNGNPSTGWQLGGQESFISRGDIAEADAGQPEYVDNRAAACYLLNITGSVATFVSSPGRDDNNNMPGEFLANVFFLEAAIDKLPNRTAPSQFDVNPALNQSLQDFVRSSQTLIVPACGSVNAAGLVPNRKTGNYADGTVAGSSYRYKGTDGVIRTIGGGTILAARNEVQGDFNRDGQRDANDINGMLDALQNPLDFEQGMPTWPPGGSQGDQTGGNVVIAHILGDFDGNGDFDNADVRYFADGLALDPAVVDGTHGKMLNRRAGFRSIDARWNTLTGGYFWGGTVLATGKTYAAGNAAADVAGSVATPGADPRGQDGRVDGKDIDYVRRNFGDWSNADEAVYMDLSAELTGPESDGAGGFTLVIDQNDVDYIVRCVLCTEYGDVNLDGRVDQADLDIIAASIATPPASIGWATGDVNGDGAIDASDSAAAAANAGFVSSCVGVGIGVKGDTNCDGVFNNGDIDCFVAALLGGEAGWSACANAANPSCDSDFMTTVDMNYDGVVDNADIDCFVSGLLGNACPRTCP